MESYSPKPSEEASSLVDKLLSGVYSESDTFSSDDTSVNTGAKYTVPYSKWIPVQSFHTFDDNENDEVVVAKVVISSF